MAMPPISSGTLSPTLFRCSSSSSLSSVGSTYILPGQSGAQANTAVSRSPTLRPTTSSDDSTRPGVPIGRGSGGGPAPGKGGDGSATRMGVDITTGTTAPGGASIRHSTPTSPLTFRNQISSSVSPQLQHRTSPHPTQDPLNNAPSGTHSKTNMLTSSSPKPTMVDSPSSRRTSAPTTPLHRAFNSNRQRHRSGSASSNPASPVKKNPSRISSPLVSSEPSASISSPPKRPRTETGGPKGLPALYQHCDVTDLVCLISDMLAELVGLNDKIPLNNGGLTRFHSRAPPTISIPDYLHRLTLHSSLQPSILLSMVYYIDILSTLYPTFTISSLTVHRFLITAATVATKGLCDSFLTNSFYAKVGGVSLLELNLLELEFLTRVGWRIVPKGEVLAEYYRSLVGRMTNKYRINEEPVVPNSQGPDPDVVGSVDDAVASAGAGGVDQTALVDTSTTAGGSEEKGQSAGVS